MPNYAFECHACGLFVEDVQLPIADRDYPTTQPCPQCGQSQSIERVIQAPYVGDAMRQGRTNFSSSWTDKLAEIKSKHRGSTIKIPSPSRREV